MSLIADILMIAGALGAAFYCMVLSRRLSKFTDLEKGVGGAIAVLSMQVDDMTKTLEKARGAAGQSSHKLEELTRRGEEVAKRLELLVASMHDLPDPGVEPKAAPAAAPAARAAPAADADRVMVAEEPELAALRTSQKQNDEGGAIFSSKRLRVKEQAA